MHIRLWGLTLPLLAGLLCGCNHFPTPFSGAPGLDAAVVVTRPSAQLLTALPGADLPPDCQRAMIWEDTVTAGPGTLLMGRVTDGGSPQPETVFERYRDNCISIYLAAIDLSYEQYKRDSVALVGNLNAGADFLQTALSAASTAAGSAGTKTLLSGIATAIGTAKTQINADVLYNTSILAAFAQMDADRNSQHAVIIQRMQNSANASSSDVGSTPAPVAAKLSGGTVKKDLTVAIPATAKAPASIAHVTSSMMIPPVPPQASQKPAMPYTMYQAANDLLIYYEDGTFAHAVVSLQEQAGAQATNCKATVKSLKTTGTKGGASSGGDADAAAAVATGSPTPSGSQPAANPNAC